MYSYSSSFTDREFEQLVRDGITAAKNGEHRLARSLLNQALMIHAGDARPYLWLANISTDRQEQRDYLERAVAADPGNAEARQRLVLLSDKVDRERLVEQGTSVEQITSSTPQDAVSNAYTCPQCGGLMNYDVQKLDLVCSYCGYIQATPERQADASADQVLDFVLPTTRAHRWAQTQQQVTCENCTSVTLLPPERKADHCPYCGSSRFVISPNAEEFLDPNVIGLMKVDAEDARQRVTAWLSSGLLSPDDLTLKAGNLQLEAAYYPFWTFDGTLELPWSCEVNLGSSNRSNWVPRSGSEIQFFDNVLIPGLSSLSADALQAIEPFDLADLLEFSPQYLAGWPALTYNIPLAQASLAAREKTVARIRHTLLPKIEPMRQKRKLEVGAGKWSGMTYKLILLPVWVGAYHYQNKRYRFLVNGQSGKIGGEKPQDRVKLTMIAVGFLLILVILAVILYFLWLRSSGS
jgi:hypothetical protein